MTWLVVYVYTNYKGEQKVGTAFVEQKTEGVARITRHVIETFQTEMEKNIQALAASPYQRIAEGSVAITNIIKLDEEST